MIKSTFSIFPGIGERFERHLWRNGVFTWNDFLARDSIPGFSAARKAGLDGHVSAALESLGKGDTRYFIPLLGPAGVWRLWNSLAEEALCLDIETDGSTADHGVVTVAGFYSHGEYRRYVRGESLSRAALEAEFREARLLVTYFGTGFDVPYLKAVYPGLRIDMPHFDLCPSGHKVGLKGGLKKVEQLVGIQRADELVGISGFEAVLLWQAHKRGVEGALDTLIGYNREDTVNLHALAWIIYERLREATGLPGFIASAPKEGQPHPKA
jgi:uncharacterized protein YprB with RNaseH-like and TPR domain